MWPFSKKTLPLSFTNTLSGKKEGFTSLVPGRATLYTCGPTVYGPVQIGNLRSFVLGDLVARTLTASGYSVTRVMNITDVGHMVADAELGEDKMAVGAEREKTTPETIAERYTDLFLNDIAALNIDTAKIRFPRATGYIKEQIAMIQALEGKGFTYATKDGIYFDTSKFSDYGQLGNFKDAELRAGARVELGDKRSPHDFVLWRLAKPYDLQKWESPWGTGNPGWSIECSAMATSLLGTQIDLHTGGEDLASIHHNNEIAQSECATGTHPFVHYWLHGAFLTANGEKLSKSAGNSHTLADITTRGIHPLALRYLYLQAHYRSPLSFTWESLEAAQTALESLWRTTEAVAKESKRIGASSPVSEKALTLLQHDLDTPGALALLFTTLAGTVPASQKWTLIETVDAVFGLSLTHPPKLSFTLDELPPEERRIAKEREEARKNRDFAKSDELRIHLLNRGYHVEDRLTATSYRKS